MSIFSQTTALFDPVALMIVLVGTLLATLARCGWADCRAALLALTKLGSAKFDEGANRAALARSSRAIQERGLLCADLPMPPDRPLAELLQTYLVHGSLRHLRETARSRRAMREAANERAGRAFETAGELAPIFGLVGTLFAITQLAPASGVGAAQATMAAVATAVLSSMYGVLSAHLLYLPLARAIERRSENEENARAAVLSWFEAEMAGQHDLRSRRPAELRDVA